MSLEENAVGQECVKKVEVYFCEVCQRYLSRVGPMEKGLEFHCRTRGHHRAYEEHQNGHKELEGRAQVIMKHQKLVVWFRLICFNFCRMKTAQRKN